MKTFVNSAGETLAPYTNHDKIAGNISTNENWLLAISVMVLAFFGLYAYKTFLDVKVAKQRLLINTQEMALNKALLDDQNITP
jgi:hypothetical protein